MDDDDPAERGAELPAEDPAEFLRSLLNAVPAFITRLDSDLRIRFVNVVPEGFDMQEVLGSTPVSLVAPEDMENAQRCFERVRATGEPDHFQAVAVNPAGKAATYITYVAPFREADGSAAYCTISMDVTEQQERERALQESETRLRLAIDATGIAMWDANLVTGEVSWSPRMKEIMGREEPLGDQEFLETALHPEDRDRYLREFQAILSTGEFGESTSYRILRPDGEVRWILSAGKVECAEDRTPLRMFGGTLDVTAQRVAEEQRRQSQKLEAIGTFAAGIAHNFNNMLMVLMPSLELLQPFVPESERGLLRDASTTTERAADMVRQLMTFAGQGKWETRQRVRLQDVVSESVRMCQRTFDRYIEIRWSPDGDTFMECVEGEILQSLMNIFLNARDALLEANTPNPKIEVRMDHCAEHELPYELQGGGRTFVVLRVEDNGPGMSADILRQVFEPFFSTKVPRGTGLGMSMSYAIAREHGGHLDCRSTEGAGTEFLLYLPTVTGDSAEGRSTEPEALRLLLIDDEAVVQRAIAAALAPEAIEVVAVSSGVEARQLLDGDQDFSIVLVDRSMPGEPGPHLVPDLRRLLPATPILYFTGEPMEESDVPDEVDGVIQKPLRRAALVERLLRAVREGS